MTTTVMSSMLYDYRFHYWSATLTKALAAASGASFW